MEKHLKLVLRYWNQTFTFYFLFMLLPTEIDAIPQKRDCKRNSVWLGGSADGKMVFALLTKVITFYVKPITVDVRGFGLEFVSRSTFQYLEECLEEVIYIFLSILGNVRSRKNRKWSFEGSKRSFKSLRRSRFV